MAQKGTGSFEQAILNSSFDPDTGLLQVEVMGTDGVGSRLANSDVVATKITTSGSITYIGIAAPGTAEASALWQAEKIDESDPTNIVVLWAGGGAFNQVATDLTALTYA